MKKTLILSVTLLVSACGSSWFGDDDKKMEEPRRAPALNRQMQSGGQAVVPPAFGMPSQPMPAMVGVQTSPGITPPMMPNAPAPMMPNMGGMPFQAPPPPGFPQEPAPMMPSAPSVPSAPMPSAPPLSALPDSTRIAVNPAEIPSDRRAPSMNASTVTPAPVPHIQQHEIAAEPMPVMSPPMSPPTPVAMPQAAPPIPQLPPKMEVVSPLPPMIGTPPIAKAPEELEYPKLAQIPPAPISDAGDVDLDERVQQLKRDLGESQQMQNAMSGNAMSGAMTPPPPPMMPQPTSQVASAAPVMPVVPLPPSAKAESDDFEAFLKPKNNAPVAMMAPPPPPIASYTPPSPPVAPSFQPPKMLNNPAPMSMPTASAAPQRQAATSLNQLRPIARSSRNSSILPSSRYLGRDILAEDKREDKRQETRYSGENTRHSAFHPNL